MKAMILAATACAMVLAIGCGGGRSAACTKAAACGAATITGATTSESSVKACEVIGATADACCGSLTTAYSAGATTMDGGVPSACK